MSPWASLAKVAILKELYNGRSLFGAKGEGTRFGLLPVLPSSGSHFTETGFHVKQFFNLFSSWRLVPPLVVWVAPFHVRNNARPKNLDQQKFLLVAIDFVYLWWRYWEMRRAHANI